MPDSTDIKFIFRLLIDSGKHIKIQDENGNAMEDYGFLDGWTNNIGNMVLTEGYKIKVTDTCQLTITGMKALLPVEIPLKKGWNIMGHPRLTVGSQAIIRGGPPYTSSSLPAK